MGVRGDGVLAYDGWPAAGAELAEGVGGSWRWPGGTGHSPAASGSVSLPKGRKSRAWLEARGHQSEWWLQPRALCLLGSLCTAGRAGGSDPG